MAIGEAVMGASHRVATSTADDGSATHPHRTRLLANPDLEGGRALDDLIHHLCGLHGRHPGVVDCAAASADGQQAEWLGACAVAFALERDLLTRLAGAIGPVPGTPNQMASEAASAQQRHALEVLARSDRPGCALGAATALMADWRAIRPILDAAAIRVGLIAAPSALPAPARIFERIEASPLPLARALSFGADQLLAQHRGLWTLLEARHEARAQLLAA